MNIERITAKMLKKYNGELPGDITFTPGKGQLRNPNKKAFKLRDKNKKKNDKKIKRGKDD